ncbi:hypothetical protein IGS68_05180 [Skermanella sp. TT6]|uniref:Uncharacterized protein n=1 Tax=Skermanella cutis TaxID=2775420 RepID=A0ABX7BA49_9PROT|nr:hypothetical protein [Skermanella sp. TT6]QQP90635.1 hypothetical protein IGS68_05180 [Skermanella sp. TT6]
MRGDILARVVQIAHMAGYDVRHASRSSGADGCLLIRGHQVLRFETPADAAIYLAGVHDMMGMLLDQV